MSARVYSFQTVLARAFERNDLDSIAQHFTYPLALYAHDGLLVFGAQATLVELLQKYRDIASVNGIVRMQPRIIAEGVEINEYSHLWVEWDHLDKFGACLRTSQARYVLHHVRDSAALRIETVEYKVMAFPELVDQLPMALPA